MFWNYLKIALRNTRKQKLLSVINIFSLAFGIAACLLIYLFIQDERSFDAFHSKKDQIYRLDEVQSFLVYRRQGHYCLTTFPIQTLFPFSIICTI